MARVGATVATSLAAGVFACGTAPAPKAAPVSAPSTSTASASASASASAVAEPAFPSRVLEQDEPSILIRIPLFRFENDAATDALTTLLEREALALRERVTESYRRDRREGRDASRDFLRWVCTPLLARPRLASVYCGGNEGFDGHESGWQTRRTYAIDGAAVRVMKPAEFFVRDAPRGARFVSVVTNGVLGLRTSCPAVKSPSERDVEAAIAGFTVDAEQMIVLVSSDTIGACGAPGYEVTLGWKEHAAIVDPAGPIARVRN
jgi:hypothetical protein